MNPQPNTPASLNEAVALVPVRPTAAMIDAGCDAGDGNTEASPAEVWAAMILAAPAAAIDAREQEPPFITAMVDARRARYALDQSCMPAFLHWLDTIAPREGVAANEAWNAGYAEGLASREEAPPVSAQAPFAYYVYIPAEQRGGLVHDLDEATDDLTNCECEVTKLYATPSEVLSPATAAQPVAYVNGDELDNMLDDRTAVIQGTRSGFRNTPLYAAQPCASQGCGGAVRARPSVPLAVSVAISAYGDARADDDGTSATRLGECINEIRNAMTEAAVPSTAPRSLDGATPGEGK